MSTPSPTFFLCFFGIVSLNYVSGAEVSRHNFRGIDMANKTNKQINRQNYYLVFWQCQSLLPARCPLPPATALLLPSIFLCGPSEKNFVRCLLRWTWPPFVQSPRNDLLDLHIFALIKMHKRFFIFFKKLISAVRRSFDVRQHFHEIFLLLLLFVVSFLYFSQLTPAHNEAWLFACYACDLRMLLLHLAYT